MGVEEAAASLLQRLEALTRQRQEPGLVREVERVLREEERARLEPRHDPVARKDTRRDTPDVALAADHEPVPLPLVPGLDVLTPVRLAVDGLEGRRPVVVLDLGDPKVAVELADDLVQLHCSAFRAWLSDCLVVRTPSNRSPSAFTRSRTASIVKAAGSSDSSTSSQRNGVETGAPGFGRTE